MEEIINIMSFDIEDWYHSNLKEFNGNNSFHFKESIVEKSTYKILEFLEKTNNSATFFILGELLKDHNQLVKDIYSANHEIGSHGFGHELVYEMSRKEFENDIEKSVKGLEDLIGRKVVGYRAPSWSLVKEKGWYWDILRQFGIQYDSSLYPYKTFLYGDNNAPRFKYKLNINDKEMIEWPPSVLDIFSKRIPFSGGFFLRLTPTFLIKWGIKRTMSRYGEPAVLYLHPREIEPDQPKIKMNLRDHFIHYYNVSTCAKKLMSLLKTFRFLSFYENLFHKSFNCSTNNILNINELTNWK